MSDFKTQRLTRSHVMPLNASPKQVFPLLCPVREFDWLEPWDCEVVFTRSNIAENNCIFKTHFPHEGETVWVVSRYEPVRAIEFVTFCPDSHVMRLDIWLSSPERGRTLAVWTRTLTGLTDRGNEFLAGYTENVFQAEMKFLEDSINHYCRTGQMLKQG